MGLLDDAIREHLELKRRHGAAEEDIAREEAEALGPARRDVAPAPLAPPDALAEDVPAIEEEPALYVEEAVPENVPGAEAPPLEPPPVEEPPLDEPPVEEPPTEVPGAPPAEEDPGFEDRPRDLPGEPPLDPGPGRGSTPPHGFPAVAPEEEPAAEGEGENEDVLEETPDFLQESPEHDRLWFEQKPPRDFDFD